MPLAAKKLPPLGINIRLKHLPQLDTLPGVKPALGKPSLSLTAHPGLGAQPGHLPDAVWRENMGRLEISGGMPA